MSGDHDKYHGTAEVPKRSHEEFLQDLDDWARSDKREWVGLTGADYEINKFYTNEFLDGAAWAETKLKEKNEWK